MMAYREDVDKVLRETRWTAGRVLLWGTLFVVVIMVMGCWLWLSWQGAHREGRDRDP